MFEVKRRRKADISKPNEDQQKKHSVFRSTTSTWMDLQAASSWLSLLASLGLSWFLFQQSVQLAAVEKKYHILKEEAVKFQDMENKISIMSEKFPSSSVLQEASSYVSMITNFEQEVSRLHNFIEHVQNSEKVRSKKFQTISENFQMVVDSWKRSKSEMDTNTGNLRLETKILHTKITSQINTVDHGLKKLSERLKDLEDSTVRNLKTLNRQEEDELTRVEEQLQSDAKAAKILKQEHNSLLVKNNDLHQKRVHSEYKLEEYKTYLPTIENAIYSIVRVSSELVAAEKRKEEMITKVFNVENEMMKAISEIINIQNTLESMQHEDSILTLQNEPLMLTRKD